MVIDLTLASSGWGGTLVSSGTLGVIGDLGVLRDLGGASQNYDSCLQEPEA